MENPSIANEYWHGSHGVPHLAGAGAVIGAGAGSGTMIGIGGGAGAETGACGAGSGAS